MPMERDENNAVEYGCIFCRSGCEDQLKTEMEARFPEMRLIFPKRMRLRRMGGVAFEEAVVLFPGYVFFSTQEEVKTREIMRLNHVYRLLTDPEGKWPLQGADRAFVEMLFSTDGTIGFSKAFYEGDRIRVAEGFLKDYEGNIIKLNKRARTAQIRIEFHGKIITMWLGYELMEK